MYLVSIYCVELNGYIRAANTHVKPCDCEPMTKRYERIDLIILVLLRGVIRIKLMFSYEQF